MHIPSTTRANKPMVWITKPWDPLIRTQTLSTADTLSSDRVEPDASNRMRSVGPAVQSPTVADATYTTIASLVFPSLALDYLRCCWGLLDTLDIGMLNAHVSGHGEGTHDADVRDIHELTPPPRPPPIATVQFTRREDWENSSHRLSNLSTATAVSMENFSSMNREINAMVISRPTVENGSDDGTTVARMGDDPEETNPLAIVPDNSSVDHPIPSQGRVLGPSTNSSVEEGVSVHSVKKEEVESKIVAWQTAEIAKANNKFKREDAIINGWESAEVQKAATWMKKVERKLEEKKAKAQEKMQNEMAKARQKAEERRASAESKRGTKVARILELANVMRVVGRAPSKRSFF